jgi:hypothetical protein
MSLFNKKIDPVKGGSIDFESILCIPGIWNSREELLEKIVEKNGGEYLAAGYSLLNNKNNNLFNFEVSGLDERMRDSFRVAGKVTGISNSFLDEIDKHNLVVYLSTKTGTLIEAENLAFAGNSILKAGGIGIKVETTGKAFDKATWFNLIDPFVISNLYEMFVVDSLYMHDGSIFSCGMQNIGFKDTIVSGVAFNESVELIRTFGYYQIIDHPDIKPQQTFSPTANSPIYRVTDELNPPYKEDKYFSNPFGMWRLTKVNPTP